MMHGDLSSMSMSIQPQPQLSLHHHHLRHHRLLQQQQADPPSSSSFNTGQIRESIVQMVYAAHGGKYGMNMTLIRLSQSTADLMVGR